MSNKRIKISFEIDQPNLSDEEIENVSRSIRVVPFQTLAGTPSIGIIQVDELSQEWKFNYQNIIVTDISVVGR